MKKAIALILLLGGCMDGATAPEEQIPMTASEEAAYHEGLAQIGYSIGSALGGGMRPQAPRPRPREVRCQTWGQNIRCY